MLVYKMMRHTDEIVFPGVSKTTGHSFKVREEKFKSDLKMDFLTHAVMVI